VSEQARDRPLEPPVAPYGRVVGSCLACGAAFGGLAGIADVLGGAWSLRRFGAIEYVPNLVALELARSSAPWRSLLVASLTTVVVVHRACHGKDGDRTIADGRGPLVGAMVLVLHLVVSAASLAGALAAWRLALSLPIAVFLEKCGEVVLWSDLGFGAAISIANAALLAVAVQRFGPRMGTSRHGLALKLVATFLVLKALFIGEQHLFALVSPPRPSPREPDASRAISPPPWHASSTS
jgi:hypothetical protein